MCFHSFFFWIKTKKYICCVIFRRFHPLGCIHWVPSVVSVAGKWTWKVTGSNFELIWLVLKKIATIYFFKIFLKKTFLFNQFFHKETRFSQHFPCFFSHLEFHHVVDHPSRHVSKTVEPQPTEGSGPSPRAIVCGLTCYTMNNKCPSLIVILILMIWYVSLKKYIS